MSDDLYSWLLFAHILAAMVWVGGAVLLGVLAIRVTHDSEPGAAGKFIANIRVIGPRVLAPATVAVVGFGVWLVLDSSAWDFGQFWVQLALALFAAAFVIGAAMGLLGDRGTADRRDLGHDHETRALKGAERWQRRDRRCCCEARKPAVRSP
jgi:uncharacterized membrane protein